jgi:predicted nucleic acid-binding protein
MAKVSVLVDTDVFIDYLNTGRFSSVFDSSVFTVYYSIVTKKELLTKLGLRETEREAIVAELSRCRLIGLSNSIIARYSNLRRQYPSLDKADALIAATALVKRLPLVTRNKRHFRIVEDLPLFGE